MLNKTILGDQWMVNGSVSANFHLACFDDDGKELMRSNPHTVTLMPDADPIAVFAAVNADITTRLTWPAIEQTDCDKVASHCAIEHTADVVAAYTAFRSKEK